MDPNKTLENIRAVIADMEQRHTVAEITMLHDELYWLIKDLDQWLTKGGFLPTDWQHNQ